MNLTESYTIGKNMLDKEDKWSVLIDTLALPEESIQIRDFVERHLQTKIRYIINI